MPNAQQTEFEDRVPIQAYRQQKLVVVVESHACHSFVVIDQSAHKLAALQHVPNFDRIATA
jgi:hypothetical protein